VIVEVPKYVTVIGLAAASFTTLSFVPQLVRTWRLRRADEISFAWLMAFTTGIVLWLVYGLLLPSIPVILANFATLLLTLAILALKCVYRERR
jgi:MtN3 and saliva related transmembrane protein